MEKSLVTLWQCSILRTHVHLVVARHRLSIESIANQLKGAATRQLLAEGLHPFGEQPYRDGTTPTPWARGKWDCFLDSDEGIHRAIAYVRNNPLKENLRIQTWPFVTRYER